VWALGVLVGLVAFGAYANSLGNGFVWDDPIVLTRQLAVFRSIGDILLPPANIPQFSPDYYRPVTIATYLVDRTVGGERPLPFHLSVVLAHAAVSVLALLLGLRLFGHAPAGRVGAAAAAVVFAVHPIHTESVAWMAGRSDVLATAFLLAALLVHVRGAATPGGSAAAGGLVLLALGAKETAVAALPLMATYDTLLRRHATPASTAAPRARRRAERGASAHRTTLRSTAGRSAGPVLAAAIYLGLRSGALSNITARAAAETEPARSWTDAVCALGGYAAKLVWPVGLNAYIDEPPAGVVALVGSLAGIGLASAAALWCWRTRRLRTLYLVLWIGLTLLPSLAIVWRIPDAPMAERYLYLPSVGFCLLVGQLVAFAMRRCTTGGQRAAVAAGLALVCGLAMTATVRRNAVWRDNLHLWGDTAAKSTTSGMPLRSLATAHQAAGRATEARRYFEAALQRRNTRGGLLTIHNNLGSLAMQAGDYAAAREHYEAALRESPNAPDALFNLGLAVLQGGGQTASAASAALPYYEAAARLSPHDPDIQAALGQAFVVRGEPQRAVQHLRRALELGASGATRASVERAVRTLEGGAS
jgi:tetratricopeptide (TPR) repeat protein